MKEIQIGNTLVGEENPCYIVAEIGINHNGDIDIAKN
jgi:sialic acid synthase SpsE